MKTIGAVEARTHLPELLDRAVLGERVTITRCGKPVAMLVPFNEEPAIASLEAAAALRVLRSGVTLGDLRLGELIDEGRISGC
jgi:prevent-host-death family protein